MNPRLPSLTSTETPHSRPVSPALAHLTPLPSLRGRPQACTRPQFQQRAGQETPAPKAPSLAFGQVGRKQGL